MRAFSVKSLKKVFVLTVRGTICSLTLRRDSDEIPTIDIGSSLQFADTNKRNVILLEDARTLLQNRKLGPKRLCHLRGLRPERASNWRPRSLFFVGISAI